MRESQEGTAKEGSASGEGKLRIKPLDSNSLNAERTRMRKSARLTGGAQASMSTSADASARPTGGAKEASMSTGVDAVERSKGNENRLGPHPIEPDCCQFRFGT